jgi:TrmH family RNA methyltransferase
VRSTEVSVGHPLFVTSRDNPLLKELRKVAHENTAYRKAGRFWVEGDHLCGAALQRGVSPAARLFWPYFQNPKSRPVARVEYAQAAIKSIVIPKTRCLLSSVGWSRPAGMGFVLDLPVDVALQTGRPRHPRPGAGRRQCGFHPAQRGAFGFKQVLALKGTAALWSPKVLRAGMGAHFGLHLLEGPGSGRLQALQVPVVVTSSHQGELMQRYNCPSPAPGPWATKGRAWPRTDGACQACTCASASRAGKSRSMWQRSGHLPACQRLMPG